MIERTCCICSTLLKGNDYVAIQNGKDVCFACVKKIARIESSIGIYPRGARGTSNMVPEETKRNLASSELYPKNIKALLDQYVIGQETAKKILAVASYNHFKRSEMKDSGIKKSNILLVGPTGSGKTYLVQTLAKILNVPLAITPATSLTEAGYIGDDVEVCIQRLLEVAGGDVKLAEHGIIFIDEIDKLTQTSSETKRQVGGKGVQQALLPLLEGSRVSLDVVKGGSGRVDVDTTNILFICGGAFPNAGKIIRGRLNKSKLSMGFVAKVEEKEEVNEDDLLMQVNTDDLIEFGLIPELLGRLPVVALLERLNVETLTKILTEPKESILSQYKKMFLYDSIELDFEEESLVEIAKKAMLKGTGARSLRGILEELLLDLMYESPSETRNEKIRITKEFVCGESAPCIVYESEGGSYEK